MNTNATQADMNAENAEQSTAAESLDQAADQAADHQNIPLHDHILADGGASLYNSVRLIDPDGRFAPILGPHIDALGYILVKVELAQPKGYQGPVLQIYAEPKQKRRMGVEDCRMLSKTLSAILDVEDPFSTAYTLEISSPGIDRALTRLSDFQRFKGFKAKMSIDPPAENGQKRFTGLLCGTENDGVVMLTEDGNGEEYEVTIDLDRITKAQLVFTKELQDATKDVIL